MYKFLPIIQIVETSVVFNSFKYENILNILFFLYGWNEGEGVSFQVLGSELVPDELDDSGGEGEPGQDVDRAHQHVGRLL